MEVHFAPEEEVAPKLLLGEYNEKFVRSSEDLSCYVEEGGVCLGGVNAFRLDTLLMVDRLWVDESQRGKGLGRRLLAAVEEKGRLGGAERVELNTFGFQAPGFYEKMGYRLFGSLEPAVGEWGHYFYAKGLSGTEIGLACKEEIQEWMALTERVREDFPGFEPEEHRTAVLKYIDRDSAFCARREGRLVGALLFSREESTLDFLAVDPDCRGQHIGKHLLEATLSSLGPGCEVAVITYREDDPRGGPARAFYRKMGFREGELTETFGFPTQVLRLRRE